MTTNMEIPSTDSYTRLIDLLDEHEIHYRLINHEPEGRTRTVSRLRGHPLAQAAKCIVVEVHISERSSEYVLAVVPGHLMVDLEAVRVLRGGTRAALAPRAIAERLTECVTGSIVPFSFHDELELVADPSLTDHEKLYFNAGRLDRSLALQTSDYLSLAKPRIESVAAAAPTPSDRG